MLRYSGRSVRQTLWGLQAAAAMPTMPVPEPTQSTLLAWKSVSGMCLFLFQQCSMTMAPSQTVPAWLRLRSCAMCISFSLTSSTRSIINGQIQQQLSNFKTVNFVMERDTVTIRLTFTRHGETEDNIKGMICGQQPGVLTKIGKEQAKKIGVFLKRENVQFDHIYVSDLGRTVDTFENIKSQAKHLEKVETTLTPLLREKAGGVLEGRPLVSWKQQADKQKKPLREYKCAKGESWVNVNERCFKFLQLLVETHILSTKWQKPPGDIRVFAIAHGGYLMQFYNLIRMTMEKSEPVFRNTAKNCSFHEFVIEYPLQQRQYKLEKVYIKCIRQNVVDHLK